MGDPLKTKTTLASCGNALLTWVDERLPVVKFWNDHAAKYYAPKNFNFFYFFGSLALLVLINQLVTGIFLAMSYKPDAELAFDSVEMIMRDQNEVRLRQVPLDLIGIKIDDRAGLRLDAESSMTQPAQVLQHCSLPSIL